MWRPETLADVQAVIGVEEGSQLEFKQEVGGRTDEIAKDIASMTIDGGVIAYGIAEQGVTASALTPVVLEGARERLRQIADSLVQPPPAFEISLIETSAGASDGFVVVQIPPSPLAPHMTNQRFPARSGTTTRYLSEVEVARLYDQRRGFAETQAARSPFAGFLKHERGLGFDDVIARTARLHVMVSPVGAYRHPSGFRVRDALEKATSEAAVHHQKLIVDYWRSRLLELATGRWEPQSTQGWKTGRTAKDLADSNTVNVIGAATYAHSGPLSFEILVGLSDLKSTDPPFAHEEIWVSETIAALALSGLFFDDVPGVSFAHVDVSLWGLAGRIRSVSPERRFVSDRRTIEDSNYVESATFSIRELSDEPVASATQLLDRLLTSFDGGDVVGDIVRP